MKKYLFLLVSLVMCLGIISCGDDDDDTGASPFKNFNYSYTQVVGTWKIQTYSNTVDGFYVLWSDGNTGAVFNANGTYRGFGSLGNGEGTFTASGNVIQTYVNGEPYLKYEIIELTGNTAKMYMSTAKSGIYIICKKE